MTSARDWETSGAAYAGWVYHVGENSVGFHFCRARYLVIKGKYVAMYKRDPAEHPGEKPKRKGVVGQFLMVEEVGRQIYHGRVLYALKIFNRLDQSKQGEFACTSAEEVEKWIAAFHHAKEEAEYDKERSSGPRFISNEDEFKLTGVRFSNWSYTRGLNKLIYIGRGPDSLLRRPSIIAQEPGHDDFYSKGGDAIEQVDWRCFRTVNGLRMFEDVTVSKAEKGTIMKSVGVVEASPDMIFETIMSLNKSQRYQWDVLTGDLEFVETIDGHTDVVYGTFDPKYLKRWNSLFYIKRDFVFHRYWRRDQDGSYSITQISGKHKNRPPKRGFRRIALNPGVWEIAPLPALSGVSAPRSLVTQIMEIKSTGWGRWKKCHYSKFHTTVPYALLSRTAGLREYFKAEIDSQVDHITSVALSKEAKKPANTSVEECGAPETNEQFYDAIMGDEAAGEDSDEDEKELLNKHHPKLKNVAWGVLVGLSSRKSSASGDFLLNVTPVNIDLNQFDGSLRLGMGEKDCNCWADPGGKGFMVRGKTYMQDFVKVPGDDPLLKLFATDWLRCEDKVGCIAKHPKCVVQSEAGKKLPFILVVNLQVPATPNYGLVFYFGADRPVKHGSLLDKFANGDDAYRNSRFKLIPSIVEGYWVVKRAVGTKACLLGRAVTCHYIREDNYLEIDVDIGSSTVARGVIGLVLGYVTNIVVDLAILIEAKDEKELPEYILGTTRISRVDPELAKVFEEQETSPPCS